MTPATPTKDFQQAAQRPDPFAFDFEREVEQVWRDFPWAKNGVVFVDLRKTDVIYPGNPLKEKMMLQDLNNNMNLHFAMQHGRAAKSSFYVKRDFGWDNHVFLYTEEQPQGLMDTPRGIIRDFDLMFGRAVAVGESDDPGLKPSILEAYSLIRHLQRFGADSPAAENIFEGSALKFAFGKNDRNWFTDPVLEQILARRHDIEWNNLTPAETVRLARRFAEKYKPNESTLENLDGLFKKFQGREVELRNADTAPLRELAQDILSTDNSDFFKWGAKALKPALEGRMAKTCGIVLNGEYWDIVRQKLVEKQKIFAQDPLLFGMGSPDRPLQHAAKPAPLDMEQEVRDAIRALNAKNSAP